MGEGVRDTRSGRPEQGEGGCSVRVRTEHREQVRRVDGPYEQEGKTKSLVELQGSRVVSFSSLGLELFMDITCPTCSHTATLVPPIVPPGRHGGWEWNGRCSLSSWTRY